jgi:N4-gp56 family major capsid protein
MGKTTFSSSDNLTVKLWSERLFRDVRIESYFDRFMGEGAKSLVQVNTDLTKSKGDNVTFGLRERLAGDGVTSGQALEGNEEALSFYDFDVSLEEYAHAVRDRGPLDRQRPQFDLDSEARDALKVWGSEKIDKLCFDALAETPTRVFYSTDGSTPATTATAATASGALTSSSKLFPDLLSYAKAWAMTGGNRTQTPLRPVKIEGKDYLVVLIHPDVMYDLFTDSTFEQARREAEVRGSDNPLFTGAKAIWNGMIIHEHENVAIGTDAGSGSDVPWAKCSIMGQQALCWAWGKRGKLVAEEFDYQREHGFAWSMMSGVEKPKFNSLDYGSVGLYVARTQISDAS